ncbi:MAG TPA: periplasmic heavy metal sensor [Stellaceae bacterium]|nr:periplasmic heavy metal sensor [Stellaceae bacterium]
MSFRITLIAAGFVALLPFAAVAPAQAEPSGGHHRHGHQGSDLGFLAGVSLTDAQKSQVHEILQASWQAIRPIEKQIHALHRQISDQLASTGAVNAADLAALQQQASQLQDQVAQQRLEAALQIRGLLTEAQLAQAAQVHQQLAMLRSQMRDVLNQGGANASPSKQ